MEKIVAVQIDKYRSIEEKIDRIDALTTILKDLEYYMLSKDQEDKNFVITFFGVDYESVFENLTDYYQKEILEVLNETKKWARKNKNS